RQAGPKQVRPEATMRLACIRNEGSKRPDEIPMPRGEGATELPSASRHGERRQATMPFDPPTMDWLTRNDLFTTAFRYLEQGELDEADRAFVEFLERTKEDPSRSLRATAMLARNAIASRQSAPASEPAPQQFIVPLIDAVLDSARS